MAGPGIALRRQCPQPASNGKLLANESDPIACCRVPIGSRAPFHPLQFAYKFAAVGYERTEAVESIMDGARCDQIKLGERISPMKKPLTIADQGVRICLIGGARVRINSSVNFDISSLTH